MRIAVGQDALNLWAWMIVDEKGHCLASDDQYYEAALAMEDAARELQRLQASNSRKMGIQ